MRVWYRSGAVILLGLLLVITGCATSSSVEAVVEEEMAHLTVIPLWPEGTPGINPDIPEEIEPRGDRYLNIHNPTLTYYKPEVPNGVAVVLCAGGGYRYVASGVEGVPTAEKLNKLGITVFVLKYRLPPTFKHPVPLSDALRAIQLVRHRAAAFNVDPDKIGIMGFSAGGHLAAAAGTLFSEYSFGTDPIAEARSRPDFMCLVYPVVSSTLVPGNGSIHALLPDDQALAALARLSNELNVTPDSPPAFLVHAKDDGAVAYQHSVRMQEALQAHGVPVALRLYEEGGHGFGIGREGTDSARWSDDFVAWLQQMNVMAL